MGEPSSSLEINRTVAHRESASKLGIINSSKLAQVQKDKKFKKLIRGELPMSLRGRIWAMLSDAKRLPHMFEELLIVSPTTEEMEKDAARYALPLLKLSFVRR